MENTMNDFSRSNSLADLAAKASAEHEAIAAAMKRGLEHALAAGDILNEAKGQLKHGQWLPWRIQRCRGDGSQYAYICAPRC
jgi:hypothetical protein